MCKKHRYEFFYKKKAQKKQKLVQTKIKDYKAKKTDNHFLGYVY